MNPLEKLASFFRSGPPAVTDALPPVQRAAPLLPFENPEDAGWGPVRMNAPTKYATTGRNARLIGWEAHPIVNACVAVVAEALAAVPVQTYTRKEDGSPTPQPLSAPARLVLDRPREGMTPYDLWGLTATHYQIYGNGFWVLERTGPRSSPAAIRLVHPENVMYVVLDKDSLEPLIFVWRDRRGRVHETLAQDVVHFRDLAAGDWLFGYPRAATALLEMAQEREANEFVRQMLVNDGSPGHIAIVEDGATLKDTQAAEARWRAMMTDRGGRGSVRFVKGIKDWKVIGFNLEQLEFPNLRSASRESICAAFRVDPRMVGASSAKGNEGGLSQAGYAEARRRLYAQTVIPMMRAFEAKLNQEYSVEWGYVFCRFDPDALADLMETEAERADRSTKLLAAGLITRQEGRRIIRLPEEMVPSDTLVGSLGRLEYPVAAESAKSIVSGKEQQAQAALEGDAAAGITPPADGKGGAADAGKGNADEGGGAAAKGGKDDSQRTEIDQPRRFLKRGMVLSAGARKEAWERFDTRATREEVAYRRAAEDLFSEERREIVTWLEASPSQKAENAPDPVLTEAMKRVKKDYKPGGRYHQRWLDRYRSLIGETVNSAGGELSASLGVTFNLTNPLVDQAIIDRSGALAKNVCDYSSEVITDLLREAQRQGMGTREAAKLLSSTLSGMEPVRATRIARTETIGALNQGEHLAAEQSEIVTTKEWLAIPDDRTRDSHAAQSGETIALSARFDNGLAYPGDQAGPPEEVINCRCTLLYYTN